MTPLILLGCDPGATGAVALLADDDRVTFIDMPTIPREGGGTHVHGRALIESLRMAIDTARTRYGDDVEFFAVIEQVMSFSSDGGSQAVRFGEAYGVLRCALDAVNVAFEAVHPYTWKNRLGMRGAEKDASRQLAIELYPDAADMLQRKKDHGRAEALLIARWARLVHAARVGERAT